MTDFKDKNFYTEVTKESNGDILIKSYKKVGNEIINNNWMIIAPSAIPLLLEKLNNFDAIHELTLKESFKTDKDEIRISLRGSDVNQLLTISCVHQSEKEISGILNIPIQTFTRETVYYYLEPFMTELAKFQ